MSSKLISTGVQFPDSSVQTTAASSGGSALDGLGGVTVSTTDPAVDSNPSATGHQWINKTSGELYVCTDNTAGSNVWVNVGEGDGGVPLTAGPITRGVFGSGGGEANKTMDYITIATTGNATDFGDMVSNTTYHQGCGKGIRGVFGGGHDGAYTDSMDYITIASPGNAIDFGNLSVNRGGLGACADATRGIFSLGYNGSGLNTIDYITIATTGNATDFGDAVLTRWNTTSCSDATRGVNIGGSTSGGVSNVIDYITIQTTGNATDFGDMVVARATASACSDATRGVAAGGAENGSPYRTNYIDYITIASTSNASDFGDLSPGVMANMAAVSDATRGCWGGGHIGSTLVNNIQYVTIQTTGNTTDFGDLTVARYYMGGVQGS
jgi:hypothetical protein